jgi:hypothetical protein
VQLNGLHGVISQMMILFITAVKTSNPTSDSYFGRLWVQMSVRKPSILGDGEGFLIFLSHFRQMLRWYLKTGHSHFSLHHFPFIINLIFDAVKIHVTDTHFLIHQEPKKQCG